MNFVAFKRRTVFRVIVKVRLKVHESEAQVTFSEQHFGREQRE